MTDKLIKRIKADIVTDATPDIDYVQDMETRILADAKIIKAADNIAITLDAITDCKMWANSVSMDEVVGVQEALAAYRKAVSER